MNGEDALNFNDILDALEHSQEQLIAALKEVPPETLERLQGDTTIGQQLATLHFHESYHVGQTEYLRQLAGTNDAVI